VCDCRLIKTEMSFFDLFFLFSLYALGLCHVVLGVTGLLSGASVVFPMPFTLNRPGLYILVGTVVWSREISEALGPAISYVVFAIVIADVAYETVRPLIMPVIQLVGASPEEIDSDVLDAFRKLSLRYAGEYPNYRVLEPYTRVRLRYKRRQGIGEVRVFPWARRDLLATIADVVAKDLDSNERRLAQRGYITTLITGVVLMAIAVVRHIGLIL
jgi:hypothetical protein